MGESEGTSDEEDSCEANADERESIKSEDFKEESVNINLHRQLSKQSLKKCWDYFPDDNQDPQNIQNQLPRQTSMTMLERKNHRFASPSDKLNRFSSAAMNTDRLKDDRLHNTAGRPSRLNNGNNGAKLCELLRSSQFDKPMFVKQGTKRSYDPSCLSPKYASQHRGTKARNTLCSPVQMSSNFFQQEAHAISAVQHRNPTVRHTFNLNITREYTSRQGGSPNFIKRQTFFNQKSESTDKYVFSVQKLPDSRLSAKSLFGERNKPQSMGYSRSSEASRAALWRTNQPGCYQYQAKQQLIGSKEMVEQSDKKNKPTNGEQLSRDHLQIDTRQPLRRDQNAVDQYYARQVTLSPEHKDFVTISNNKDDSNSPQLYHATTARAMPRKSLLNRNMIQVDENYFDHLHMPESVSSSEEHKSSRSQHMPNRKSHQSKGQPACIIDTRARDNRRQQQAQISSVMSNKNRPRLQSNDLNQNLAINAGECIGSDSPTILTTKSKRKPLHVMDSVRRSFQERTINGFSEAQSITHELSSAGNLISFIQKPNTDAVTANSSVLLHPNSLGAKDDFTPSGDGLSISHDLLDKPIVPRMDYIPAANYAQTQMMSQVGNRDANEEVPDQSNVGWFTSLTLSVSQLFTGAPADTDQVEKKDRKLSNGEVPIDEEENESDKHQPNSSNQGVRKEATRLHQGGAARKKILLMDSSVPKKGAVSRHQDESNKSHKESLMGVQSYNQIDSGSEQDYGSGSEAYQRSKDRQKVISYTTSKHAGDSPNKDDKSKLDNRQIQQQRQHSSSMHEKLNIIGASFSNLASSLIKKGKDTPTADCDNALAMSPQPRHRHTQDEESKFGVFSRLLDRVTKTNQKEKPALPMNLIKTNGAEDYMSSHLDHDDQQLDASRKGVALLLDESQAGGTQFKAGARQHSKTVHNERRPLLQGAKSLALKVSSPEEKLRQIDTMVFNQDKSHFAILWTDGGFTKFDVATLKMVQRVFKTPEFKQTSNQFDFIEEVQPLTTRHVTGRKTNFQMPKALPKLQKPNVKQNRPAHQHIDPLEQDSDDQAESEIEQFKCLALQHRTYDYLATLVSDPKMVIFVHIKDETPSTSKNQDPNALANQNNQDGAKNYNNNRKNSKVSQNQVGERTHAKHFNEEVTRIEILPEARFTVICLQTCIYVYSSNTQELYDIVPCSFSSISSAIYKKHEKRMVLAYLSRDDDPGETLLVHDYSIDPKTGTDKLYQINKPFSSGYKVGGIQLDALGKRVVVVSADGCYIYLYCLQDGDSCCASADEQVGQDQATPEYGSSVGQDAYPASAHVMHIVTVKTPQQSFARSSSSCKQIYLPIQIVEGFSTSGHTCDFILLSSSSMTTHMFALKTEEELIEQKLQQKESSWTFSRFLPSTFTLDRSKIRLNILEELAPVEPQAFNHHKSHKDVEGRLSAAPSPVENAGANVYKQTLQEYPYTCFVESSGLLVVISHQGYCCKFSIDLQNELPSLDLRYSDFNSVRQSRYSPQSRGSIPQFSQGGTLSHSLAQLKDLGPKRRPMSKFSRQNSRGAASNQHSSPKPRGSLGQHSSSNPASQLKLNIQNEKEKGSNVKGGGHKLTLENLGTSHIATGAEDLRSSIRVMPQSVQNSSQVQLSQKKATAFSGYQQPTLRLKFKIQDFFIKVDRKAESLRRIRKRDILKQRTLQYKELLQEMHRSKTLRLDRAKSTRPTGKRNQLKTLLQSSNQMASGGGQRNTVDIDF